MYIHYCCIKNMRQKCQPPERMDWGPQPRTYGVISQMSSINHFSLIWENNKNYAHIQIRSQFVDSSHRCIYTCFVLPWLASCLISTVYMFKHLLPHYSYAVPLGPKACTDSILRIQSIIGWKTPKSFFFNSWIRKLTYIIKF